MDKPLMTTAEEHTLQMERLLQQMLIDVKMLQKMAELERVNPARLMDARRSLQADMELFNARLVFTTHDLEKRYGGDS